MRSTWKVTAFHKSFFRKSYISRIINMHAMRMRQKRSPILFFFEEKNFRVYCGNKFLPIFMRPDMRGSKLGSFVMTKRITSEIHKKEVKGRKSNLLKKKK